MTDVVDRATRSRMMSGIRSKNTKPELIIRKALHRKGFRYRLHVKELSGRPDIVLPKYRAVIFVHGCFWHGHDCRFFKVPSSRTDFWLNKIETNRQKGQQTVEELVSDGWRICIVWECALRGGSKDPNFLADRIAGWIHGNEPFLEVKE